MSGLRSLVPSPHSLFVFEAAARHLNFKTAAAELNVTQPSVSQTIKALEQRCGVRLFQRESRGVQLTHEGRELYDSVRHGFQRMEESLRAISSTSVNYLTFAASTSAAAHWLMPQIYPLQHDHPSLKIKVVTTDRDMEPDAEVDLTIWIRDRDFQRPNSWFLCDEVIFPVCSPAYLAQHAPLTSARELGRHRLLHAVDRHRKRIGWSDWLVLAGEEPLPLQPDMVFHDYLLAIQAALAGEGVALGWNLTFAFLLENRLLVRPFATQVRTGKAFFLIGKPGASKARSVEPMVGWLLDRTAQLRNPAMAPS